jgi:hypothetical protein
MGGPPGGNVNRPWLPLRVGGMAVRSSATECSTVATALACGHGTRFAQRAMDQRTSTAVHPIPVAFTEPHGLQKCWIARRLAGDT